jgi:hypothetical protein
LVNHSAFPPNKLAAAFACLKEAHSVSTAQTITVFEAEMQQLARLLLDLVLALRSYVRELQTLFKEHPDSSIFSSLPGAGDASFASGLPAITTFALSCSSGQRPHSCIRLTILTPGVYWQQPMPAPVSYARLKELTYGCDSA